MLHLNDTTNTPEAIERREKRQELRFSRKIEVEDYDKIENIDNQITELEEKLYNLKIDRDHILVAIENEKRHYRYNDTFSLSSISIFSGTSCKFTFQHSYEGDKYTRHCTFYVKKEEAQLILDDLNSQEDGETYEIVFDNLDYLRGDFLRGRIVEGETHTFTISKNDKDFIVNFLNFFLSYGKA